MYVLVTTTCSYLFSFFVVLTVDVRFCWRNWTGPAGGWCPILLAKLDSAVLLSCSSSCADRNEGEGPTHLPTWHYSINFRTPYWSTFEMLYFFIFCVCGLFIFFLVLFQFIFLYSFFLVLICLCSSLFLRLMSNAQLTMLRCSIHWKWWKLFVQSFHSWRSSSFCNPIQLVGHGRRLSAQLTFGLSLIWTWAIAKFEATWFGHLSFTPYSSLRAPAWLFPKCFLSQDSQHAWCWIYQAITFNSKIGKEYSTLWFLVCTTLNTSTSGELRYIIQIAIRFFVCYQMFAKISVRDFARSHTHMWRGMMIISTQLHRRNFEILCLLHSMVVESRTPPKTMTSWASNRFLR